MHKLAAFNWSGGKDSTLALHYILLAKEFHIHCLVTTVNEGFKRIAMHGVREDLLITQAKCLNLPLHQIRLPEMPDMEVYETAMNLHFELMKQQGVAYAVFGDIFLEDLRKYREAQFEKLGMTTIFPLWKMETKDLVREFIDLGYKTIVVCAREDLKDFCGRIIDESFLNDLPACIDPCGENGEFHTFVFDGPIFSKPIEFKTGELVFRTFPANEGSNHISGFWYIDLIPL